MRVVSPDHTWHTYCVTTPKYRLPQVRSEFVFELLDRIGPLNRFGRLVVVGEKVTDGLL